MLHINILCVGKLKEKYFKDALQEYSKRLGIGILFFKYNRD